MSKVVIDGTEIRDSQHNYPRPPIAREIDAWKELVKEEFNCEEVNIFPKIWRHSAEAITDLLGQEVELRHLTTNPKNEKGWYKHGKRSTLKYAGYFVAGPCFDFGHYRFADHNIYEIDTENNVVYIYEHINLRKWEETHTL